MMESELKWSELPMFLNGIQMEVHVHDKLDLSNKFFLIAQREEDIQGHEQIHRYKLVLN